MPTKSLTAGDDYLILGDVHMIMGSSLTGFRELVADLGGDPDPLLHGLGINPAKAGHVDEMILLRSAVAALELAAQATNTPDFGRQLALRQSIDILGPVGVAARTASTVGEVFSVFNRFVAAYSPGIDVAADVAPDAPCAFIQWQLQLDPLPAHRHTAELSLGIILDVLRRLMGPDYSPTEVRLAHRRLTDRASYETFYGCPVRDETGTNGLLVSTADLLQPIDHDAVAHESIVLLLGDAMPDHTVSATRAVAAIAGPMLPSGSVNLDVVAGQLHLHPKALQRRLATEGTSFAQVLDTARRETAERYLRDTDISMLHLSRQLGFAEQSVFTRASRRWFGRSPLQHRHFLRADSPAPSFGPGQ